MSQNLDSCFRLGLVDELQERAQRYAHIVSKQGARSVTSQYVGDRIKKATNKILEAELDRVAARIAARAGNPDSGQNVRPFGPTVKEIITAVCEASGLSLHDLMGEKRPRKFARARQMGYAIMRDARPDLSLPAIGHVFGGKDHTTVWQGLKVFEAKKAEGPICMWLQHPAIVALGEGK